MNRVNKEHYTGCLLGGAAGDALGSPIEFEKLDKILKHFGPCGVMDMVPGAVGLYEITDDTQMTLFTAEGLLRAMTSACSSGRAPKFAAALKRSYLCWLATQGERGRTSYPKGKDVGWLLAIEGLHHQREPGDTCLTALCEMTLSTGNVADNDRKGCGGVMRAAPAGLLAIRISDGDSASIVRLAFKIGCETAALTHGHPSGYYPAGVLAAVISAVILGETIEKGVEFSLGFLDSLYGSRGTVEAIKAALRLFHDTLVTPSPEAIESLGKGWEGHEALAIGLYCSLTAGDDFARGVRLAVNHSGDSDSTGSITGNIMGALLGEQSIPSKWLERLELADVIRQVGSDLFTTFEGSESWKKRYPPV